MASMEQLIETAKSTDTINEEGPLLTNNQSPLPPSPPDTPDKMDEAASQSQQSEEPPESGQPTRPSQSDDNPINPNTEAGPTTTTAAATTGRHESPETSGVSIEMLTQRLTIYKAASLKAKQENKLDVAKYYQDAVRDIDYLIREAEIGFPIDAERVPKIYSAPAAKTTSSTTTTTTTSTSKPAIRKNVESPPNLVYKENSNNTIATSNSATDKPTISTNKDSAPKNGDAEDEDGFVIVTNDPSTIVEKDRIELYKKLERQLLDQKARCKHYEEQFTQNGDMAMAGKFKIFAASCAKDMDLLHIRWKNGDKFPLVKYENFTFSVVPCNVELSSNELSLDIVKGINFPVSSNSLSYVMAEFAHPAESKQTGSVTPKQSQNPHYDQKLKFSLNRDNRATLRTLKRRPIKLDIYKKEPFWRCDSKIGSVSIKLGDLANKCTLHDCHTIMNGRRSTESKVEVIVRIRNALVSKEPEVVHEKWLVFT